MPFKNYTFIKMPMLLIGSFLILASCGSYQNVPDNDGIYGSTQIPAEPQTDAVVVSDNQNSSNTYYKNYFKEKADEYDVYTQDEVFTDVDDYSSEYREESDSTYVDYNQYAGWGQENSNVSINVYSGFNNGWNYGWGWNAGWGWGWNAGWGWGYPYNYWGWNAGWGWGYPNYGWGYPGLGWAYCPPYYGGGYYSPYYRNSIAYTNGRRGSIYMGRSGRYTANSNSYLGRNVGRRTNTTTRNYNSTGRPNTNYNSSGKPRVRSDRPRSNSAINSTGRPRTQTTKPTRTRTRSNNSSSSRPRVRTTTPSTRNYNSTPSRSYSSPSRGSSSMGRSSGGGGRRGGF